METIKNYLEAMFANLPNTPEVKKAKAELLTMMEDKYNELVANGQSENSAVGTVISEFGNLDELAEDLGLTKEVEETKERAAERPRRFVRNEEVLAYLNSEKKCGLLIGIGVMLCICCVNWPIIQEFCGWFDAYGVAGMFISIAIAVGLFVFSGISSSEWSFLKKEPCQVDMATAQMVKEKKNTFKTTYALMMAIGVLLCAFCWLPVAILKIGAVSCAIFLCVGVGVLLFIYSNSVMGSYDTILKLNDAKTISGSYGKENDVEYVNKTAEAIMEVFWPTITCIYLIISFVTMDWGITWIIWPVAAIVHKILNIALAKED
jgi:hypothetical protein